MNEAEFSLKVHRWLGRTLPPEYACQAGRNLLYKVIVDPHGEYRPSDPTKPSRGQFAFQTDILVVRGDLPLVVLELKYGGFSTHDILTYSAKAVHHKEVYPYLRYGFAVGGKSNLDLKFFTHNVGFDFAIAVPAEGDDLHELDKVVCRQLEAAEQLVLLLSQRRGGDKPVAYESTVSLQWNNE